MMYRDVETGLSRNEQNVVAVCKGCIIIYTFIGSILILSFLSQINKNIETIRILLNTVNNTTL